MEFLRRVGIGGGAKAGAATAERKLLGIILKGTSCSVPSAKTEVLRGSG